MKRILFVNHVGEGSGAEKVLLHTLQALGQSGYYCAVACPPDGRFAEQVRRLGVRLITLRAGPLARTFNPVRLLRVARSFLSSAITLIKAISQGDFDIVHANSFTAGLYSVIPTWLTRRPLVWHMHDILTTRRFNRFFVRLLGRRSAAIVCVSKAVRRNLVALGVDESKCVVIYSALYEPRSRPEVQNAEIRQRLGLPEAGLLIGIVGQLAAWKGQDVFLRAAKEVHAAFPKAHFLVIGDVIDDRSLGYKNYLHQLVSELGLDGNVLFSGHRTDILEIMASLDILVHASTRPEPLGIVLLEGLAAGCCIVATRGGGVPEIIQDKESGLLVGPSDPNALADVLIHLLQDEALRHRLQHNAIEANKRFDPSANLERLTQLYDQLMLASNAMSGAGE